MFTFIGESLKVNRYDFIFSNKPSHRLIRHLVFWILYCLYSYIQIFAPENNESFFHLQTYKVALLNTGCFIPACIFSVYTSIYFLLPLYLLKKRYASFIVGFILLCFLDTLINYSFISIVFKDFLAYTVFQKNTFLVNLEYGYYHATRAFEVGGLALGIKLIRNWYLQQKENLEIARKKIRNEVQLQKARIQPEFLFRSLDNIYSKINSGSDDSPAMILKLSDLLSYLLYDADAEFVLLENELSGLKDFIFLEQTTQGSYINLHLQIDEEIDNEYITPMVLLSVLQDVITMTNFGDMNSLFIKIDITSKNSSLFVKLFFDHLPEANETRLKWPALLQNIHNRLSSFYQTDNYQIQIAEQEQKMVITIKLPLLNRLTTKDNIPALKTKTIFYESA